MSSPGWYPDPAGNPQLQRYWDGGRWSEQTRMAPQQTQPSGPQQQWPDLQQRPTQAWGAPAKKSRTGLIVALVAVVVIVLGGGTAAAFLLTGEDEPDPSSGPSSQTPSQSASESSGEVLLSSCPKYDNRPPKPPGDGTIRGGGLSLKMPRGYEYGPTGEYKHWSFPWGKGQSVAQTELPVKDWYALLAVAELPIKGGYGSLQHSAESVLNCVARSEQWFEFASMEPLKSEPYMVEEFDGWHARARVTYPEAFSEESTDGRYTGEVISVVVVQGTKEGSYGLFIGGAPDEGPKTYLNQLDQAIKNLDVID